MPFQPLVNDILDIDGTAYRIAEHPAAPGIPYGQEGRQAVVYQLISGDERRALKVFKPRFRVPGLVALTAQIVKYADLPGLAVCHRSILTQQRNSKLLERHPDLQFAVLMPWIEGPTWMEVILARDDPAWDSFTPQHSVALGNALAQILAGMEQRGIAHCDLSASNVLLPTLVEPSDSNPSAIELVDVEELYAANLSKPNVLPGGSDGYAHKTAVSGVWSAAADRFAGAVLIAEMLGWCDARIRKAAFGEQFFDPGEMQQDTERYCLLRAVLQERWGTPFAEMFERAWQSKQLSDCPPLTAWATRLDTQTTETRAGTRTAAALFKLRRGSKTGETWHSVAQLDTDKRVTSGEESIARAQEFVTRSAQREQDGDLDSAVADMRRALDLAPRGSTLKQELAIALTELVNRQERMAELNPLVIQAKGFENARQWKQAATLYQELVNRASTALEQVEWQQAYTRCASEAELDDLFDQGHLAFQQHRLEAAEEILTEVVRRRPRYSRGKTQAAVLLGQVVAQRSHRSARPLWQRLMFVVVSVVALFVITMCVSLFALQNPMLNLVGLASSQTETPVFEDTQIAIAPTPTLTVPAVQTAVVQSVIPKAAPTANPSATRNLTPMATFTSPTNARPLPTASSTAVPTRTPSATSTTTPTSTPTFTPVLITGKPSLLSPSNGATMTQGTSVNLLWSSVTNATQYLVEYWSGASAPSTPCGWQSGTSCNVGMLTAGTYYWHAKARNANSEGSWSDTGSFTIQQPVPNPPTLSSPGNGASFTQGANITLQWSAVSNATQYKTEVWGGPYSGATTVCDWQSSTICSLGQPGTGTISWRVKARNASGESQWSSTWSFIISVIPVSPPQQTGPSSGSNITQGTNVTLTWNASSNAIQYKVEVWGGPYGGYTTVCNWQSNLYCGLGTLNNTGTFYWRVKARGASNQESDWSSTWSITVQAPPTGNMAPGASRSPDGIGSGNAFDGNLSTFWTNGLGHAFTLRLSFSRTNVNRIIVWDRPQNSPDNNQINALIITLSNGWSKRFGMQSGGARCIDVTISPAQSIDSVTLKADDASGNNGLSLDFAP